MGKPKAAAGLAGYSSTEADQVRTERAGIVIEIVLLYLTAAAVGAGAGERPGGGDVMSQVLAVGRAKASPPPRGFSIQEAHPRISTLVVRGELQQATFSPIMHFSFFLFSV